MAGGRDNTALPLVLTMGDPAGIGPDITLKAWLNRKVSLLPVFCTILDPSVLEERMQSLGVSVPLAIISEPGQAFDAFAAALPVLPLKCESTASPGTADPANAKATIESIRSAVNLCYERRCAGIITNPIHKSVLHGTGFAYAGHTEYLGALVKERGEPFKPVMMLAARELRIVPVTIHIPLRAVPETLTKKLIVETTRIATEALRRDFGIVSPRIAVSGLNPHAGEGGSFGHEEEDIIQPALDTLKGDGIDVSGPHSGDTLFSPAKRQSYDCAVAMYHDQALIPIKTLFFDSSVNVTLGLPFVRTSPDHGTAYDIAGTGKADAQSLIEAILLARTLADARYARQL